MHISHALSKPTQYRLWNKNKTSSVIHECLKQPSSEDVLQKESQSVHISEKLVLSFMFEPLTDIQLLYKREIHSISFDSVISYYNKSA
jgi:hypothetical protein